MGPLVRGNALVHIRSFVLKRHGAAALDRLALALHPRTAASLTVARSAEWYPATVQSEVLVRYDQLFGQGDLASTPAIGAFQCARDLTSSSGWLFRLFSPPRLLQNLDLVWRRFHSAGRWNADAHPEFLSLRLHDWSGGSAATCASLRGYVGHLLRDLARRPVELRHARCAFADPGAVCCEYRLAVSLDELHALPFDEILAADVPVVGRELTQLESQRAVVDAILAILRAQSAGCDMLFSLADARESELRQVAVIGRPRSTYEHRWILEGRGRIVARIDAQLDQADLADARLRAVGEWIPWFAMALANAERSSAGEAPTLEQRVRAAAARWTLTERQTEVLALLVHGRSNRQIALELDCAEGTVEVHVKALFKKADVAGRTELTARVAEMATRRVVEPA